MRYSYARNISTGLRSRSASASSSAIKLNNSNPQFYSASPNDHDATLSNLKLKRSSYSDDSSHVAFKQISSIFYGGESVKRPDSEKVDGGKEFERMPNISWLSNISRSNILLRRKEFSRARKQQCVFEVGQESRFGRLLGICAKVLGTEATIELFGKVGRKLGLKEYSALIEMCIERARGTDDDDVAIEEMGKVFHLFKSMGEQGLDLEEQTYRPLLLYIIDMCMVEEFQFFCDVIKDENPSSLTRLGYYEMKLWLRVNNGEKIQGLCNYVAENDGEDTSILRESYLLALCESERKKEILELLKIIDIKKLASVESVAKIFQALGRLLLEPTAERFLMDLKSSDHDADNITNFIASYVVSIPNLSKIEDVITKFKDLNQKLEVSPSSSSYEKLILQSCALVKVHVALDIVDEMCEAGLTLSTKVLHSILQTCEETFEYDLVHRVFSTIHRFNLETNDETFRCMIGLFLKMKYHHGAYKMLDYLEKINLKPTGGMYNAIMAECFQEVLSDPLIPVKSLNQIKSVLVSFLASLGQLSEALLIYKEIKQAGHNLDPEDIMRLIEQTHSNGELDRLLLLLEELNDTDYWNNACCRIILYCVWNKHLSSAVDLCKLLRDKLQSDEQVMEVLFDKVFSQIEESESKHLDMSLELLSEIEDKLGLYSHECNDLLLSAQANATDLT